MFQNDMKRIKSAFTLAEVLITLGIIGIVAAMTLPALIQKHRTQVVETRLKKFYTVMNEAVKMSELTNGEFKYWGSSFQGYDNDSIEAWYNKYFRPYVKTLKTDKEGGILYVYLADGSKFRVFNHVTAGAEPGVSVNSIHLYFYPNANTKTDIMGKDLFTFFINSGVNQKWAPFEPYKFSWNGTRDNLINGTYGCRLNNTNAKHYCTALIQYNNWKVPKDYPYKF